LIAKGLELASSPRRSIDSTFTITFNLPIKPKNSSHIKKTYRNPINLAKEYKKMIDTGEAKNKAELARIKGISRARVTQILNLLKLDKNIIDNLEQAGDPTDKKSISKRVLRKIIHQS
jgi:hypothetical protein